MSDSDTNAMQSSAIQHSSSIAQSIDVPIIGYHHSALSQKFGIPRQPNLVDLPSIIEMSAPYNTPDAFDGLQDFSHLWITWQAHHNHTAKSQQNGQSVETPFKPKVRPPRLGGNTKLGVFATRSTYRPAPLGLSVVQLVNIEVSSQAVRLHILGADMIDGTPIIDIKPYIVYTDALPNAQSGFAKGAPIQKTVKTSELAKQHFKSLIANQTLLESDVELIRSLIAQDPRPAYRQIQSNRVFTMRYKTTDISFEMDDTEVLWIMAVTYIADQHTLE